jgi:hypothetical protein
MDTTRYIVIHRANAHYLRGTVWTSELARATVHASVQDATAAIDKAARFNRKAIQGARIMPHHAS